eukprot:15289655-Alexandrium_andersonii.AAC.1
MGPVVLGNRQVDHTRVLAPQVDQLCQAVEVPPVSREGGGQVVVDELEARPHGKVACVHEAVLVEEELPFARPELRVQNLPELLLVGTPVAAVHPQSDGSR